MAAGGSVTETDVFIVGGGPVGLALAIELGRLGVDCVLAEARDGVIHTPKMNFANVRTMEFCRRWGITEPVRAAGHDEDFHPDVIYATSVIGHEIMRLEFPPLLEQSRDVSPAAPCLVSQYWFDPILLEHARTVPGVHLRHLTRCTGFKADANGVTAHFQHVETGAEEIAHAQYLIGCDGATSGVREAVGIKLEGLSAMQNNLHVFVWSTELLDIRARHHGQARFYFLVDERGHWGEVTSINGRGAWRFGTTLPDDDPTGEKVDLAGLVRHTVGCDFDFTIRNSSAWASRKLVADKYISGRVFLAGDSCHQLSPTGGFGMNTGVGDAVDLAWKLWATLRGWGGSELLQSYEIERRPIAVRNVEEATRNFNRPRTIKVGQHITEDSEQGAADRKAFAEDMMAADILRHHSTGGIAAGYRYDPSPVIIADGSEAPPDDARVYTPTARPGHRAPHFWLGPDHSVLDEFGNGFVLVDFGGDATDSDAIHRAAEARGVPLKRLAVDDADAARLYVNRLVLVRPDGHVAWRGDRVGAEAVRIIDCVRGAPVADRAAAE